MRALESAIAKVLAGSGIVRRSRRREVERELRCHMEDCAMAARAEGVAEEGVEAAVAARFGDANEVGRGFAWVYRRERAVARMAGWTGTAVALAAATLMGALALQGSVAAVLGRGFWRTVASAHTLREGGDVLATVAFYLVLRGRGWVGTVAVLALAAGVGVCLSAAAPFLVFGVVNALLLLAAPRIFSHSAAQMAAVSVCFVAAGSYFWMRYPAPGYSLAGAAASWTAMGFAYQGMTRVAMSRLAARLERD